GAGATRGQREFPSTWHRIDSASDLRIAVVKDLCRGPVTIGRRQYVVAQLSLCERPRFVELVRRNLEDRFAGRELLQFREESICYGVVFVHEFVIKLDRTLNRVLIESLDSSSGQLE